MSTSISSVFSFSTVSISTCSWIFSVISISDFSCRRQVREGSYCLLHSTQWMPGRCLARAFRIAVSTVRFAVSSAVGWKSAFRRRASAFPPSTLRLGLISHFKRGYFRLTLTPCADCITVNRHFVIAPMLWNAGLDGLDVTLQIVREIFHF